MDGATRARGITLRICAADSPDGPPAFLHFERIAFNDDEGGCQGVLADIAVDGASLANDALVVAVDVAPESLREICVDFTDSSDAAQSRPRRFSGRIEGAFASTGPWRAELRMEVDPGASSRVRAAPFRFVAADPETATSFELAEMSGKSLAIESRFRGTKPGARIRLDTTGLGNVGKVTLAERDPATLPPLLPGQKAVGPAVHVVADRLPTTGARLDLPYDADAARAAGLAPADLVVLALDDEQIRYRELRPIAVDESEATLTVVTDRFSSFFPGTPGIRIDAPRLYANAIGEWVGYSGAVESMVAGEVTDDRAIVEVDGVVANRAARAFARGGIPLPIAGDRVIDVTARLPDRPNAPPHTVRIAVRRHPPPKRVALGSPLYGHELVFDSLNRPHVSYGVTIGSAGSADDVEAFVAGDWARLLPHYGHRLAFTLQGDAGLFWDSRNISDPTELHEELAASAIADYSRLPVSGLPPIRSAPPDPQGTQAIRSMAAFIDEQRDNFSAIAALYGVFRLRWPAYALGVMTYSPTAPIAVLPDGITLGIAYVHASRDGIDAARSSGVAGRLRELFVRTTPVRVTLTNADGDEERVIQDLPLEPTAVAAGRLVYRESAPYAYGESRAPERLADGIWCSRVAIANDPRTGQPVIAAIGTAPDLDDGSPRSRLLLYRRQDDGRWTETLVDDRFAYVDVDLALESDGDARLVACVSAGAGGDWRLVEIEPDGARWRVGPLLWSLPGIAATNIGVCPRIVIDSANRSVVGFVADVAASPRYVAGVRSGGRWSFAEVGKLDIADVFGTVLTDTDGQAAGQVVRASGQSLFHFAPALAPSRRAQVQFAFGGGALHLARIDTDLATVEDRRVADIDRSTGFAAALARRSNAACAVVYRDIWGAGNGRSFGTSQPIHFFSPDSGPFLPGDDAPDAPIFRRRRISMTPLFEDVGLTCRLLRAETARDTVRSAVFNNAFDLRLYPEGSGPLPWWLGYWYTHNRLADMIWRLPRRTPAITQLSILSTGPGDGIERVDVLIAGVIVELKPQAAMALEAGRFALGAVFADHGLAVAPLQAGGFDVEVVQVDPDENGRATNWEIVANDPFGEARRADGSLQYVDGQQRFLPEKIFYTLRTVGDRINLSVRPLISVAQVGDPDPRVVGHYVPCGIPQPLIDEFAGNFADQINEAFAFDIGDGFDVDTIDRVALAGVRMSSAGWIDGAGRRQGAFRGVLTVPVIAARGSEVVDLGISRERFEFRAQTRSPSTVTMEIAPFVTDNGRLSWYLRQVRLDLAAFDVDVGVGFDKALLVAILGSGVAGAVLNLLGPGLGGLGATSAWAALFADPIAGAVVTDIVNDRDLEFDTGGIVGFVRDLFQEYSDRLLDRVGPLECCYLDGADLHLVTRQYVDEGASDWGFIRSSPMRFTTVPTGGQAAVLSDAIRNFGSIPALIVSIEIEDPAVGLSLLDPPMFPARVDPGNFLDFRVQYDPVVPGSHQTRVTARDLSGRAVSLEILATAESPFIEAVPTRLAFGPVAAGEERILAVRVANTGRGALTVTGLETSEPAFAPTPAPPVVVAAGGRFDIGVRFSAPARLGTITGQLSIASNAPNAPTIGIELVAVVHAAGTDILLNASRIDFPAFPVDPQLPPIAAHHRTLQINNLGLASATVLGHSFRILDAAGQPSRDFTVLAGNVASVDPQPRPLTDATILPGDLLELLIRFRPTRVGASVGELVLDLAGALPDLTVPLTGEGVPG